MNEGYRQDRVRGFLVELRVVEVFRREALSSRVPGESRVENNFPRCTTETELNRCDILNREQMYDRTNFTIMWK